MTSAKILCVALLAIVVAQQAHAQLLSRLLGNGALGTAARQTVDDLSSFRRNTVARLAGAGSAASTAGGNIASNAVTTAQDTTNTGLGVVAGLARTAGTFGANRVVSLADSGSNALTAGQAGVEAGLRIAQDAANTGLNLIRTKVNLARTLGQNVIGVAANLVNGGLRGAGSVIDSAANLASNAGAAKSKVLQSALGTTGRVADRVGASIDDGIANGLGTAENMVEGGADAVRGVISRASKAASSLMDRIAAANSNASTGAGANVNVRV